MRVILQEKIANLGSVGDQVSVKPGFARNYLLPQGKAVVANEANLKEFESRRAELEKAAEERLDLARQRAEKINGLSVTIEANASEEGKLFGSVMPADIAEAITKSGIEVVKSEVSLPEGPIRNIGEYAIAIILHGDVTAEVQLNVVSA